MELSEWLICIIGRRWTIWKTDKCTAYFHFHLIMNQLVLKLIWFCQENRNSIQYMLGPCTLWISWKLRNVSKNFLWKLWSWSVKVRERFLEVCQALPIQFWYSNMLLFGSFFLFLAIFHLTEIMMGNAFA